MRAHSALTHVPTHCLELAVEFRGPNPPTDFWALTHEAFQEAQHCLGPVLGEEMPEPVPDLEKHKTQFGLPRWHCW